jgi:PAS domain S-box-containing protein
MTADNESTPDTLISTENDDIEKMLRVSEERYRSLVSAAAQIVWTTDSSGHICGDMATWCAYTGQNEAEMDGEKVLQAIHPDDRKRVNRAWKQAIEMMQPYEAEYRLRRYDGIYRYFAARGVPVLETDGSICEWVGVCSDINESRLLEEHLRESEGHFRMMFEQAEVALQESNRRMEEFLGVASHELRTPLTTIKANIQLAMRRLKSLSGRTNIAAEEINGKVNAAQDMLTRAERQVGVLNRLIGNMIDISRIQADKLQLHLRQEPANLVTIVQAVVQEQRKAALARSILLEMPAVEMISILADPDRIGQVLMNYISNALKYSEATQPVEVRLTLDRQEARVSVYDRGPGLSSVEQQRIWECFYQAPGIKVLNGSGVGLGFGLYISQTIIARHQGQVGVQSEPGKGSTFWFTLPIAHPGDTTENKA